MGRMEADETRLLTPQEVADILRITPKALAQRRARGDAPPATRIGRNLRYDRQQLDAWLNARRDGPAA